MSKRVLLMILDGWGISPDPTVSAVAQANTPFMDSLSQEAVHNVLHTDGMHVGLPEGQMGNSEVGHVNLGAGRVVYQDLAKINMALEQNTLKDEVVLKDAFAYAKTNNKAVHFLGLVSDGGVHAHINHLEGLIKVAHEAQVPKTDVHAFSAGRDVDPKSDKSPKKGVKPSKGYDKRKPVVWSAELQQVVDGRILGALKVTMSQRPNSYVATE